jgi:hypothetical protein
MADSLLMKLIDGASGFEIPSYPILAFEYDPDETDRHNLARNCVCFIITHINTSSIINTDGYIYMNTGMGLRHIVYLSAPSASGRYAAYFIFACICVKNGSNFDVVGYDYTMKKFSFSNVRYFTVSSSRTFYVIEVPLEN